MDIKINDNSYTVEEGLTLEALLPIIGIAPTGIAIAVDGAVVPRAEWNVRILSDGASVVIIKAFYGG